MKDLIFNKEKHIRFIDSIYYYLLVGSITLISWIFSLEIIGMIFLILVMLFVLYITKDPLRLIAPLFLLRMCSHGKLGDGYDVSFAAGICFVIFMKNVIFDKKFISYGKLFMPFVFFVLISIITVINTPDIKIWATGLGRIVLFFSVYVVIYSYSKVDEKSIKDISYAFITVSLVTTLQICFQFITSSNLLMFFSERQLDLGWAYRNLAIYSILFGVGLTGYLWLSNKTMSFKNNFIFITLVGFQSLGVVLSTSRSGMLVLLVLYMILMSMYIYQYRDSFKLLITKKNTTLFFVVTVVFIGIFVLSGLASKLYPLGFTFIDDRVALWEVSFKVFKEHPIIGSGGICSSRYYIFLYLDGIWEVNGSTVSNYHNYLLQSMTLGIVGILCFIYYSFTVIYSLIIRRKDLFPLIVLSIFIVFVFVNGFLQPTFYHFWFAVPFIVLFAVTEKKYN